mgnify:CR=1 FL=1
MLKHFKKTFYTAGAAFTIGIMGTSTAYAADPSATVSAGTSGGNDFSQIANNIITSITSLPALISGLAYLGGTLFGVLGILKIKDHVENPSQTKLKDGAIQLAAGGGLFALPIVFEAMFSTIGEGQTTSAAVLNAVDFSVN